MANKFSKYKPEEEKAVRTPEVVKYETQLKLAWNMIWYKSTAYQRFHADYENMLDMVKTLEYSAKDIEEFSLALGEFQGEKYFANKAGLFLSALINNCNDKDFIIHTVQFTEPLGYIGYRNTKNIVVNGDAGELCGERMEGGSIIVNGDAGDCCGEEMEGGTITVEGHAGHSCGERMKGGAITVKGNACVWCGLNMRGGSITVKGDVGNDCGAGMHSGEIRIEGEIGSIYDESETEIHGKIYHKGKLIVDR